MRIHVEGTLPRQVGMRLLAGAAVMLALGACGKRVSPEQEKAAIAAFATVEKVFQHPRCSNCHIPGDQPLQFDHQGPHAMGVVRGKDGHGAAGLPCAACHGEKNLPASYGPNSPPGAPHWGLPPPDQKMAWIGLSPKDTCEMVKDKKRNGDRDLAALLTHVSEDKLVLWGWNPGGTRAPVAGPHDQLVAAFKTWADAGGPCPG